MKSDAFHSNKDSCILAAAAGKVVGSPWTFFPSAPELISCLQNASSGHLVQTYTLHSMLCLFLPVKPDIYQTGWLQLNWMGKDIGCCGGKVYPSCTSMHWKAEGLLWWKESEGAGSNQYLMTSSDSQPLKQLSHGNTQKCVLEYFGQQNYSQTFIDKVWRSLALPMKTLFSSVQLPMLWGVFPGVLNQDSWWHQLKTVEKYHFRHVRQKEQKKSYYIVTRNVGARWAPTLRTGFGPFGPASLHPLRPSGCSSC